MDIRVRHTTRYSYSEVVTFGNHRLMLRPRDSFDMRIMRTNLSMYPQAEVSWMHDVYGNSVAIASFQRPSDLLLIDSELVLRRFESTGPKKSTGEWQRGAPIAYSDLEAKVLMPFMQPDGADLNGSVTAFAGQAVTSQMRVGDHPLMDISRAIHSALEYRERFEEGTNDPGHTLLVGQGSCRDFAWLFIECARHLGYAARFVSGYLHNFPDNFSGPATSLAASTGYSHAWAEVYVPGDGWVEFDPTNGLVADGHLIRVAVTRTPQEASPVSGSFIGTGIAQPEVSVVLEAVTDEEFVRGDR